MQVRGVSKVSYYQDVKDPNIPVEVVKARLENICAILDINPPETIVYEESWGSFQRPRLLDDGRTIILFKSQDDSVLNWQICNLYHTLASRKSPRWIVRHVFSFMLLPVIFVTINVFALIYLEVGSFDIGLSLTVFLLQFPFAAFSWYWKKGLEDDIILWRSSMKQAGLWPDNIGNHYNKLLKRIPYAMILFFIFFALLFGWMIVTS
nr:MAG: hypothetical protein AM325_02720 [Candidatus Thorarchaeota archaeon SMTZ1-45]